MLLHIPSCSSSIMILDGLPDFGGGNSNGANLVADKSGSEVGKHRRIVKPGPASQSQSANCNDRIAGPGYVKNIFGFRGKMFCRAARPKQAHPFCAPCDKHCLSAPFTHEPFSRRA